MSLQAGWNKIFHFFLGLTTDFFFFSIDSRFLKPRSTISLLSLFPCQRPRGPLHTLPLGCPTSSQLSGVDGVRGPTRAFAVEGEKTSLPWNEEALGWAQKGLSTGNKIISIHVSSGQPFQQQPIGRQSFQAWKLKSQSDRSQAALVLLGAYLNFLLKKLQVSSNDAYLAPWAFLSSHACLLLFKL